MSIDVTSTAMSVAAAPSSSKTSSGVADKSSTESSFKEEMLKATKDENVKSENSVEKNDKTEKVSPKENKSSEKISESKKNESEKISTVLNNDNNNNDRIDNAFTLNAQSAFQNANILLENDIAQMAENSANISNSNIRIYNFDFGNSGQSKNSITMNEQDAQFFINLTKSEDVSTQNMVTQAQNMLNSGLEAKEVAKNFKISETLLNALRESRQNNEPIRIDFDQNIAVILRVSKDGSLAARFIPGDRAVEQYLKSNIESLKSTFEEKDLPYSELSYSNNSRQQNQKRRNNKQGE